MPTSRKVLCAVHAAIAARGADRALDLDTGGARWQFTDPGQPYATAVVNNHRENRLFVKENVHG